MASTSSAQSGRPDCALRSLLRKALVLDMSPVLRIAAYVYPGWHPTPERDAGFHSGLTEWELVRECAPRFAGHAQPKVSLLGEYDERDSRKPPTVRPSSQKPFSRPRESFERSGLSDL